MSERSAALPDPDHLPHGEEKAAAVRTMFDAIAPRYDLLNRVMTFRMDVGWRRRAVASLRLEPGSSVLDLACGTGDFCVELADAGLAPVGADVSLGMLRAFRGEAPRLQADATALPVAAGRVDGATCGFALRNFVALTPVFDELARVVRPGGRIAVLEVSEPENRILRWGHSLYFGRVVPAVGGLLSDRDAYRYLPRSVSYLPEPAELLELIEAAGFEEVERTPLSTGIVALLTGTRR